MKRVLAVVMTVIMLISSSLLLASCSKDDGDTIHMYYINTMYDFDPSKACLDDNAMKVFSLIYEPLFTLDSKGKVKESLAKDYKIDKDSNSLTLTLRETYWSDGERVTNEDVLFAWQRILAPTTSSQAAPMLYEIKNAVNVKRGYDDDGNTVTVDDLGIVLNGSYEVVIYFESKDVDYNAFLRNLTSVALTPLREDIVSKREDYWATRKATIVTNGPFTIGDYDILMNDGAGIFTVTRNKYYNRDPESNKSLTKYVRPYALQTIWDLEYDSSSRNGIPYSSGAITSMMETEAEFLDAKLEEFSSNTLFYIGDMSLAKRSEYNGNKDYKKILDVSDRMSTYSYVINCNVFPAEVRSAMSKVLDRQYIAELVTFGRPATGLVSYGVFNGEKYKKNKNFRDIGGELISTSAVSDDDISSLRSAVRSSGIDLTKNYVIKCKNSEEDLAVAKYAAEQWEKLGLRVRIQVLSYTKIDTEGTTNEGTYLVDDLRIAYTNGDFDIIAVDYQMYSTDAFVSLAGFSSHLNGNGSDFSLDSTNHSKSEPKLHVSNYSSAAYDELITKAYEEKNAEKRAEILHDAEKVLMEDLPIIPLYFNQMFCLQSKKLKKVELNYYALPVFTKAKI